MGYVDQHRYQKSPNQQNGKSQNQWQHQQQPDEGHSVVGNNSQLAASLLESYLEQRIAQTDQADPILPRLKDILARLRARMHYERENVSYQRRVDALLSNPRSI
jgi:uncharacterized protein with von Willebrand factor type A (vWA) domain